MCDEFSLKMRNNRLNEYCKQTNLINYEQIAFKKNAEHLIIY